MRETGDGQRELFYLVGELTRPSSPAPGGPHSPSDGESSRTRTLGLVLRHTHIVLSFSEAAVYSFIVARMGTSGCDLDIPLDEVGIDTHAEPIEAVQARCEMRRLLLVLQTQRRIVLSCEEWYVVSLSRTTHLAS